MALYRGVLPDGQSKPVSRSCGTSLFGQHIEIKLQSVLNREYTLRLFVGNEETELHTQDNRVWTPAQRPYVPWFLHYIH